MIKSILAALALIAATLAGVTLVAAPAQAGTCTGWMCGGIWHYAPDDGYDAPFAIRCNYGDPSSLRLVYEGQSGNQHCQDVDQVYVNAGTQIACVGTWGGWEVRYDATGWHKIYDHQTPTCVYQLD